MLGKLYLLRNFNNYFNRKIIKYSTLNEYLPVGDDGYFVIESTNFVPGDGVNTQHIMGGSDVPFDASWKPDYALYVEQGNIISRWFVTKCDRTRGNQYKIRLKRDSVADYLGNVLLSPCFIERAHLKEDDPLIVNSEDVKFNQKKTAEYYLKDETKVPWVVCYLNQNNRPFKKITAEYSSPEVLEINNCPEIVALFGEGIKTATEDQNIEHKVFNDSIHYWFQYQYGENAFPIVHGREFRVECDATPTSHSERLGQMWQPRSFSEWDLASNVVDPSGPWGYTDNGWDKVGGGNACRPMRDIASELGANMQANFNNRVAAAYSAMGCTHHSTGYSAPDLAKYQGKMIRCNNGQHFIFSMQDNPLPSYNHDGEEFYQQVLDAYNSVSNRNRWVTLDGQGGRPKCKHLGISASCSIDRTFKMSKTIGVSVELDLLGTATEQGHEKAFQTHLLPYDIICFPAFNTTITKADGTKLAVNGNAGINIARAITEQLGTENLYDIQMLPYCPCRDLIGTDGDLDLRKIGVRQALPVQTSDTTHDIVTYCFWATSGYQSFTINKLGTSIEADDEVNVTDVLEVTDRKMQTCCDMYRLSSPNYASQFDFNLGKCAPIGLTSFAMDKFKVDICFRPHNPYIHIAPNFSFLYGGDFNDSRGLICSGDFGLTTLSNAWTEFQIRNKNYQNIFDRETANLEIHNKVTMGKDITQAVMGTLAGAAFGGMAGKATEGIFSGLAGAGGKIGMGVGAGLAAGAGIADVVLNKMERDEDMAYRKDVHSLQLDNIQALPNSITHSAALTNNFKFYPILEYYTCTSVEKQAFEQYIQYYGMNVGRIDNIYKYVDTNNMHFIKGQLIRMELLSDDSNIASDIYSEVDRGLYI